MMQWVVVSMFALAALRAASASYPCSQCGEIHTENYQDQYDGGMYKINQQNPYGGSTYGDSGYGGGYQQPEYAKYNYETVYKPTTYNYALDTCQCYGHGDPRYTTCDGRRKVVKGTCKYTMAKPCNFNHESDLPYFEVKVKQKECFYNGRCMEYVEVDIVGYKIRLMADGTVLIKKADIPGVPAYTLPWDTAALPRTITDDANNVEIYKAMDDTVIVEADFGLFIYFGPGVHNKLFRWVEVIVPACYAYHICGICGNYNGMASDDMVTSQGVIVDYIFDKEKAAKYHDDSWIAPDFDLDMFDKCYGKCLDENCGCLDDNERRHEIGERWFSDDCSIIYTCVKNKFGRVYKKLKNTRCLYPNECRKVNGVAACYSDGPCLQIGSTCSSCGD